MKVLVTGSSGLIGSAVCEFFGEKGCQIHGVDNNQRAVFFGESGDTRWNQNRLEENLKGFQHHELDIRNRGGVRSLLHDLRPGLIVHAAAQPSHDRSASIVFDDFEINALGTLNFLEAARHLCPDTPFVFMSTNKVYGDRPNAIPLREEETRWDYDDPDFAAGISENLSVDQSKHSLFGASKLAADVLVQEYGRYFDMPTCALRGGCLTGPNHSGVELHGFLSYLCKCNLEEKTYRVFGYKGKQVRDNIHAEDVARFIWEFYRNPRCGEVYNIGGGRENSCSILEAFSMAEAISGIPMKWEYLDENRSGDHICYYSDLRKARRHYPEWRIGKGISAIFTEIVESWKAR